MIPNSPGDYEQNEWKKVGNTVFGWIVMPAVSFDVMDEGWPV